MTTQIPLTVYNQIVQTNSSPVTIAVLLNETEAEYSNLPRHFNSKRVYPFWKICEGCSQPYPCQTKEQAHRNKYCSKPCLGKAISQARKSQPSRATKIQLVACTVCGKIVQKPQAWLKRVKQPTCSRQCNGVLRGVEWARHGYKGAAAVTPESRQRFIQKMTGPNNPAWKGGVTYFKRHGNYVGVKYVRCPAEFLSMSRKDGYVMEHRLLVAQAMGRMLLRTEVVHHINHNPADNRVENLMLFASNRDHKLYEARGTPQPLWQL